MRFFQDRIGLLPAVAPLPDHLVAPAQLPWYREKIMDGYPSTVDVPDRRFESVADIPRRNLGERLKKMGPMQTMSPKQKADDFQFCRATGY